MRLYSGTTAGLVDDSAHNRIATKLSDAFSSSFGFRPHEPEVRSWRESLRALCQVFQAGALVSQGVILEYQLPMCSKRLDCLLTGSDEAGKSNAVIIELKQWDRCEEGGGANEVVTWVGGANRDVLHPSAQVRQYKMYLEDSHTAFSSDDPIRLSACGDAAAIKLATFSAPATPRSGHAGKGLKSSTRTGRHSTAPGFGLRRWKGRGRSDDQQPLRGEDSGTTITAEEGTAPQGLSESWGVSPGTTRTT
jgi:hypothetical protein